MEFKATPEENGTLNFLDLTITRKHNKLIVDIYRKPTCTDTTIDYYSNHPMEHKTAAYRHHIWRMYNLPLTNDRIHKEWKTIKTIATRNNLPMKILHRLNQRIKHQKNQTQTKHEKRK
jgi:hypothetical protein